MNEDHLNQFREEIEELRHATNQIADLSRLFSRVGSSEISDELFDICVTVSKSTESIRNLVGKVVHERLDEMQKNSDSMLNFLLNSNKDE
ncbi:MAG: hypothetical protein GY804_11620 [Alphaproteobacteria bacterium]|nr:hypothetical protein [Alphaproteobacteria bacterium]